MTFTGKVAVVTGGSRGIGRAIARVLIERGARVAITATSDAMLAEAAAGLKDVAGADTLLPLKADVRRPADVEQAIAAAARRFGGIDILVNNAGVGVFRPVAEMSVDEWHRIKWKLSPDDVAQVVGDLIAHRPRSLPSRVELRPSRPPRKG